MTGDMNTLESTEQVKRYSAGTIVSSCLVVIAAAYALSWAYAFAGHYSPLVYLNIVITIGAGWLVGKVAETMIKMRRINSPAVGALIGLVGGLFLLWFSWLVHVLIFDRFIYDEFDFSVYWAAFNPSFLLHVIDIIANNPMWVIGKNGGGMPAILYYLIWAGEAAVLVIMPASLAREFVKSHKLCDSCGDWVKATGDVALFAVPEGRAAEIVDRVSSGDVAFLPELSRVKADDEETTEWLEAHGYACSRCEDEDSLVSVVHITMVYNKKSKKMDRTQKKIAQYIPVDVALEKSIFEVPGEAQANADAAPSGPETAAETGSPEAAGRTDGEIQ